MKYLEYCRDIRESGRYLLDVINDILDMSKIEAGRTTLEPELVELDSFLVGTTRLVAGRAAEKQLAIIAEIEPSIRLRADRRMCSSSVVAKASRPAKPRKRAKRSTPSRSAGSVWVCSSATICSRCSTTRRNR